MKVHFSSLIDILCIVSLLFGLVQMRILIIYNISLERSLFYTKQSLSFKNFRKNISSLLKVCTKLLVQLRMRHTVI